MPEMMLPPEYQEQLDAALRKQKLAQMLAERSMNPQMPQQGRVASKISPLAGLAGLVSGGLGGYLADQGQREASGVRGKYTADENAEVQRIIGLPEAEGAKAGTVSPFSRAREVAKSLQERLDKRRDKAGEIVGTSGDVKGALGILNGSTPTDSYTAPEFRQPEFKATTIPGIAEPIPTTINYDKYGRPTGQLGATGTKVAVNMPGEEGKLALKREQDDLEAQQGKARAAQKVLATTEQLMQVLQEGADTGGLADPRQTARKFFSAFGAVLPETGPTDRAKQLFGEALLDNAKKLGINPTDTDAKRIQEIVGTIETDPNAIPQLLAWMNGGAVKSLQDFGQFVEIKKGGEAARKYPGLYDTADVGIRMPSQLYGPQDVQLKTIEALRQHGGDISKFADPSGQAFSPGATFNDIKTAPITPPNKKPAATGALTSAEQAELAALRKKLGR